MLSYHFQRSLELPVTVDRKNRSLLRNTEPLFDAGQDAADSSSRKGACARQLEQQNFVHHPVPVLLCPTAQLPAGHHARLVIVRAEIGGARVGNINRDE